MEYSKKGIPFFDREISWLGFNERVLQEAEDDTVPVVNRLHFLAIFSSNLDEFYKVRVASIRHMIRVAKKESRQARLLSRLQAINRKTVALQNHFGQIYREQILPELNSQGIFLRDLSSLSNREQQQLLAYFDNKIRDAIRIIPVSERMFLQNEYLYHMVRYQSGNETRCAVVPFPWDAQRFFVLSSDKENMHIVFLDDVLRLGLRQMLGDSAVCWSFKLNRDAELYLNDELAKSVKEKVKKSLKKRKTGIPSRFLYDGSMPGDVLALASKSFKLDAEDFVEGGRYHNYFDFWKFPYPERKGLTYAPFEALPYPPFDSGEALCREVEEQDHLLHFPYQDYDYLVRFLGEAANDPEVVSIKMTLYRAAKNSAVFEALKQAAHKGKEVLLFNEVQARFDEENNMWIGNELEKAGARVLYSYEGLKVHSKILLITRVKNNHKYYQSVLATGNFNEKTAKIYSDLTLFTASQEIGKELESVFQYLENPIGTMDFSHLLVAKHNMRDRFYTLIDREISNVENGGAGKIFCKMNSLQDRRIIEKLYEASQKGVGIKLLVRGICCLIPGREGISENIEVRSVVGRFLEHARVFVFHNEGNEEVFAGSADWMARNLKRRIEVIFPVTNPNLKEQVIKMMQLQWNDNRKARCINQQQSNPYCFTTKKQQTDSQHAFYEWLKDEGKH